MTLAQPIHDAVPFSANPGKVLPVRGRWNLGRLAIPTATAIGLASFFFPWIDNRLTVRNGFAEWTFVLIAFFVYPLLQVVRNRPIRKAIGLTGGLLALGLTTLYIASCRLETYEHVLFLADWGTWIFLMATALLCLGVFLYRPVRGWQSSQSDASPSPRRVPWRLVLMVGIVGGIGALVLLAAGIGAVGHASAIPSREVQCLSGHDDWVYRVGFSPDGGQIWTCSFDGFLRFWNTESGKELRRQKVGPTPIHALAFSTAGVRALCGTDESELGLWDVATGEELRRLRGHAADVLTAAFSPLNDVALSGSDDRTLRLWDLQSGKELRRLEGHFLWVNCVTFSPDGHQALSGSLDKTVRLWDVSTGMELRRCRGHLRKVNSVAFSPDARFALSACEDASVRLWDLSNGEEIRCFKGHEGPVHCAALTPDGLRAVSGGDDGTVRVWDVIEGTELHCFRGHQSWINCLAVSPDGSLAVSGSPDGTARVWLLPR